MAMQFHRLVMNRAMVDYDGDVHDHGYDHWPFPSSLQTYCDASPNIQHVFVPNTILPYGSVSVITMTNVFLTPAAGA